MNLKLKILAVFAIMIAATGTMMAQSADASANILAALECENLSGAEGVFFGDIIAGANESTVRITADAEGSRSLVTGDATLVTITGAEVGSARFDLTGLSNALVDLTVDEGIMLWDGNGHWMDVDFTLAGGGTTETVTLDINGDHTFYVGGVLTVKATQYIGHYEATFNVTAEYQ